MRHICVFVLICGFANGLCAQNNTSPYSIIGIGDIEDANFDKTAGMANTGLGLWSDKVLLQGNPASLSRLADHLFTAEVSGRYRGVTYIGKPVTLDNYNSADMQIVKFALAIKVKPFWGISVGVLPFSNSSYSFYADKSIAGVNYLNHTYYEGSGGLNQFYVTNSLSINKNLSIGVQTSYLFGSFLQTETLDSIALGSSLVTNRNIYMSKMYAKAGVQYRASLSKKWALGIGATGALKTRMSANYYLTVTSDGTIVTNNESIKNNYFSLPDMYSVGLSLKYKNKLTLAGDYSYQNWNSLHYHGLGYTLVDSHRFSAGIEYAQSNNNREILYEKYNLQAGVYYSRSYLYINGTQLPDYGFTFGGGFGSKSGALNYQLNTQIGTRGVTSNNLVKETYVQFGITISYKELWYTKMNRSQ